METFKKVFLALIILVVISTIILCLNVTDAIDFSSSINSNGVNDTGQRILNLATEIFSVSILFSRAANVIANKKNTFAGYLGVFLGLISLLFTIITLISPEFEMPEGLNEIYTYTLLLGVMFLMIFEIPPVNNTHVKYQRFLGGAAAILVLLIIILTFSAENATMTTASINGLAKGMKAVYVGIILVLAGIIINPMLRVYLADKSYDDLNEIDEILSSSNRFQATKQKAIYQPTTHKTTTTTPQTPPPQSLQQIMPEPQIQEATTNVVMPTSKVINPVFQQNELPEAIIPSIDGIGPTITPTPTTQPQPVVVTPEVPITMAQPVAPTTPVIAPQPIAPTAPVTTQQPVVEPQPVATVPGQPEVFDVADTNIPTQQ